MDFPCIDKLNTRTAELDNGPEPSYDKIVTGYEKFEYPHPFLLDHGGILPNFEIAYETWGQLNEKRDNAILIHTGLSASSHAKSHPKNTSPGWWENFIGPGSYVDTNKFFVICTNVIGGCYGSTGPSAIDPADGERYATRFPIITIFDMVRAQFKLLDHLGIDKLHASVGSSMGGMQSIAAAKLFPDRVNRLVSISACARSHPYSIALRHTQRQVLMADPNWNKGFYYKGIPPHVGMKLAREIATISYRSGPEWELRFGRKRANEHQTPALCPDFLIETYLDHQGEKFCLQYDPNSLLYISKAMDIFDMSQSQFKKLQDQRRGNTPKFEQVLQRSSGGDSRQLAEACRSVVGSEYTALEGQKREAVDPHPDPIRTDLVEGMKDIHMPALVLGVQSDILFPVWQQKEIAECLREGGNKHVTYYELDAMYGHDTFLIDRVSVGGAIKGHLELLDRDLV
ncbi:homoserine O-acetyltransferase [Rhizopus microsporus var. microsporus]|uniref:Homoserine O-acetyltransferase n=2 Tax=Rhizopus microsporus TaxID=58291 RepID=A0A2G4SHD4_RHIZD|nr:homoserine O-acetyltransferase [Rhizopus microsporus ATCC 52813]ORE10500.1 homoserine O-acetyltransferase [Rhizopus microsporus var. microsporus]PHZ08171.1 homoserine O-acetyltransferase [Rhizopus microsporus ATCC 52813]